MKKKENNKKPTAKNRTNQNKYTSLFMSASPFIETYFERRMGFPCSSVGKESACSAGDPGSIPGLERSPGGGHGNPLQHA